MTNLAKGANCPLSGTDLSVTVSWRINDTRFSEIDATAFLLNIAGKVSGDEGMVFYGQRNAFNAVRLDSVSAPTGGGLTASTFRVDLDKTPATVEKIAFTATIDDGVLRGLTFDKTPVLEITVANTNGAIASFQLDTRGASECALILGELYKRNGQWKFRAIGQGFNGGLKPLAEFYGVEIEDQQTPPVPSAPPVPPPPQRITLPPTPPPAPSIVPVPAVPAAPPPPSAPVSLSKISLSKAKPTVSLQKKGNQFSPIRVNLNWSRGQVKKGLFRQTTSSGIDLDLGCLWEMKDGEKGVVQALGEQFGGMNRVPYIELDGDDRTGARTDGEWLTINAVHWDKIKRVLIFAFIYEGVADWAKTDGVITLHTPDSAPIEVRLDDPDNGNMCAVALIENDRGQVKISREVRYFRGHRDTDKAYRWGMRWTHGSKD